MIISFPTGQVTGASIFHIRTAIDGATMQEFSIPKPLVSRAIIRKQEFTKGLNKERFLPMLTRQKPVLECPESIHCAPHVICQGCHTVMAALQPNTVTLLPLINKSTTPCKSLGLKQNIQTFLKRFPPKEGSTKIISLGHPQKKGSHNDYVQYHSHIFQKLEDRAKAQFLHCHVSSLLTHQLQLN